eukprot:COSAG02_NODE_47578_length_340_cov_0.721992_1_plen_85_part_01
MAQIARKYPIPRHAPTCAIGTEDGDDGAAGRYAPPVGRAVRTTRVGGGLIGSYRVEGVPLPSRTHPFGDLPFVLPTTAGVPYVLC